MKWKRERKGNKRQEKEVNRKNKVGQKAEFDKESEVSQRVMLRFDRRLIKEEIQTVTLRTRGQRERERKESNL